MADSVVVNWNAYLKVLETLDLGADIPTSPARTHNIATGVSGVLNGTSTVPATKVWSDDRSVSGTSETLDLTALARLPLVAVDASGLKLQALLVIAKSTNNASGLSIGVGASNGYPFIGAGNDVLLLPGQVFLWFGNDKAADVGASAKTIDIACTDGDDYKIICVFG